MFRPSENANFTSQGFSHLIQITLHNELAIVGVGVGVTVAEYDSGQPFEARPGRRNKKESKTEFDISFHKRSNQKNFSKI